MAWSRNLPPDVSNLLHRLQQEDAYQLGIAQLEPILAVAKAAITVSVDVNDILQQFPKLTSSLAAEVARLALSHQRHHCTSQCESSLFPGQNCQKFFPRLPCLFSLVARTPLLNKTGRETLDNIYAIHVKLQGILRSLDPGPQHNNTAALVSLLEKVADHPQPLPDEGGFTWAGATFLNGPVMQYTRQKCEQYGQSLKDIVLLTLYHMSLLTRRHAKYLPKRSVSEVYVANYNPILLLATQSNLELDLITHTPHNWFSYMTKSGNCQTTMQIIQRELEEGEHIHARHLAQMTIDKKREVTLGEAFSLIDPHLSLFSSNVSVKFLVTGYHPVGVEHGEVLKSPQQSVVVNYVSR